MTSEGADKIIAKVGELVTEAIQKIEFRSGDRDTTKVLPGFPFTVVKEIDGQVKSGSDIEYVAPWFPEHSGFYSTAGDGGSDVFFLPFDPATTIDGAPCYDTPRPSLFIPKDTYRLIYLEQTFQVDSWQEGPYSPVVQSVTAGPASIFSVEDGIDNIPYSSYPGASEVFLYPGEYTYYFLMARLYGVGDAPAQKVSIPDDIWVEDGVRNYGARQMVLSFNPFSANFPGHVFSGSFGITAGDNMAEGGYLAYSYPAP